MPLSGLYTIVPSGAALELHIRWQLPGQEPESAAFAVTPGGPALDLGEGRQLSCTVPAPDTLVTALTQGDTVLHHASRVVSGSTMTITQRTPEGETRSVYRRSPIKQVLVYRRDLKMRKGKIAAQVAHASMRVFFKRAAASGQTMQIPLSPAMSLWVQGRFTKVVLSVGSEEDLLAIHEAAKARGVPTALITDSGKTEFNGVPTRTTVAVGPAAAVEIDPITGRDGLVATKLA